MSANAKKDAGAIWASLREPEPQPVQQVEPEPQAEPEPSPPPPTPPTPRSSSKAAPRPVTRQEMVSVSCFLPKDVHKRLKLLAVSEDTEIQGILIDALNAYFRKREMPLIPKPPKAKRGPKPR